VAATDVLRADEDTLAQELRGVLRDSVAAHLVADVPVGVFLSGGIDSGALAALAAEQLSEPLQTFSVGFEERTFDERSGARAIASHVGADHHEVLLRPGDAAELLPRVVAAYDEPFGDSSMLPTFAVSELAARHVKVTLSGEGGDELFGGYLTYAAALLAPRLGRPARALLPLIERIPSSSRRVSLDYKARRFARAATLGPVERMAGFKEILSPDARHDLLGPDSRLDPVDRLRARWAETAGAEHLARLQDLDEGIYLADDLLTKSDRASMAHSLEVRVPFCDTHVAGFAHALPQAMKVRRLQTKRLLRRAVAPLLPDAIIRGPKRGFSIPAAAWLRGPLLPLAREVLSPDALRSAGLFDPAVASRLLEEHTARRDDHSRALWGLVCFSLWSQTAAAARRCS
jgi:asparagine synthase (glutamine-hydrolysing)